AREAAEELGKSNKQAPEKLPPARKKIDLPYPGSAPASGWTTRHRPCFNSKPWSGGANCVSFLALAQIFKSADRGSCHLRPPGVRRQNFCGACAPTSYGSCVPGPQVRRAYG